MRLRNMLKMCLVFCKSEPRYAYKRYAYKKKHVYLIGAKSTSRMNHTRIPQMTN